MSVQFHGKKFTFIQPDGSTLNVKGWGDQHYAVFETLDGYTVVKDPHTGFYVVAALSDDGDELEPSGISADSVDIGVPRSIRISRGSAKAKALSSFQMMEGSRRCEQRREQRRNLMRAALSAGGPAAAPPTRATVGDFVGLCLLIDFPDEPAAIAQTEIDAFCNQQGYTGFGNNGSVYDYYFDNSLGQFRYTNVVTTYYRAKHQRTHYTDSAIQYGTRARQLIREALDHLKSQGFDFSQLTTDSDGYVYALNVYYAGICPNTWREGLWPHSWHLGSEYDVGSGNKVFDYQFTDMGNELTLGTFCHENGHMVCDYPDLYDYGDESSGVGAYCLMCSSSHDEKNPVQISAYLKRWSGWSSVVTPISPGTHLSLSAGQNDFAIYPKNQTEYFIVENRYKTGRDASLPSSGLAIWHVDELGSNNNEHMTPALHYELSLEQADNRFDLERKKYHSGDLDDLYPNDGNNSFTDSTTPSSKWWDGSASALEIIGISPAGPTMEFRAGPAGQTFKRTSNPEVQIPDDDTAGISDVISFSEDTTIFSAMISVNITHTYRGDLRVTVRTPWDDSIALHQRQGGGSHNLKTIFDVANLPALNALRGHTMQGNWTLHVQDLAAQDVGVLHSWEIEFEPDADPRVVLEESPGTRIPDQDPSGIERTLSTTKTGSVGDIEIMVDITHTYIQDLMVSLISPQGTRVDLHNMTGGGSDNIVKTYTTANTPQLDPLLNEQIQGDWKLHVSDHASRDEGKLNSWGIKLRAA